MDQSICVYDGCVKPRKNAGYCWKHYDDVKRPWRRVGDAEYSCVVCGSIFLAMKNKNPTPKYCSRACASTAGTERRRLLRSPKSLRCRYCGEPSGEFLYCRRACKTAWFQNGEKSRARSFRCESCDKKIDAMVRDKRGHFVYRKNAIRCLACMASARPHRYGFSIYEVAEASGTNCPWCGNAIDLELAGRGEQLGPSIDHKIPWSRGGSNDLSNLQLMHRICNSKKGITVL